MEEIKKDDLQVLDISKKYRNMDGPGATVHCGQITFNTAATKLMGLNVKHWWHVATPKDADDLKVFYAMKLNEHHEGARQNSEGNIPTLTIRTMTEYFENRTQGYKEFRITRAEIEGYKEAYRFEHIDNKSLLRGEHSRQFQLEFLSEKIMIND